MINADQLPAEPSAAPLQLALAALVASRQRLRGAMIPTAESESGSAPAGKGIWRHVGTLWRHWRRQARRSPVLEPLLQALQGWTLPEPWRQLGRAVGEPLNDAASPLVRRHPWAAVLLAAAAGATLVAVRPWRWMVVSQQLRLARKRTVSWVLAQAGGAAGQALLVSLLASIMTVATTPREPPAAAGADAPPPGI